MQGNNLLSVRYRSFALPIPFTVHKEFFATGAKISVNVDLENHESIVQGVSLTYPSASAEWHFRYRISQPVADGEYCFKVSLRSSDKNGEIVLIQPHTECVAFKN